LAEMEGPVETAREPFSIKLCKYDEANSPLFVPI